MKTQGYIININEAQHTVTIKLNSSKDICGLVRNDVVELVSDIGRKHVLRKKIFSLIGFLWNRKNYDIFGNLKETVQRAVEASIRYKGEAYAREFYRFNIHIQCRFTEETLGIFPAENGEYVRMFGETARSLSNISGVTYERMLEFFSELEYLVNYYCGYEYYRQWEKSGSSYFD